MKEKFIVLATCCLLVVCKTAYNQCSLPFPPGGGINLCLQGQASISNTNNTITIPNPTTIPASGSYTVTFNYFSRTTGRCSGNITCASATVGASGGALVITLGTCATLPANFYLSPSMQINLVPNFSGPSYYFLYINRDCGLPLPITISRFEVESIANGEVTLGWTTTEEIDASHFIVERISGPDVPSPDMELGRVNAVYPTGGGAYHFTDRYALNGYNAYRLRMVDNDGTFDATNYVYTFCSNCNNTAPPVDCSTLNLAAPDYICSGTGSAGIGTLPYYCAVTWSLASTAATLTNVYGSATTIVRTGNEVAYLSADITGCTLPTRYKAKMIKMGKAVSGYIANSLTGDGYELYNDGTEHFLPRGSYDVIIDHPSGAMQPPTWRYMQGNITWWQYNSLENSLEFFWNIGGNGFAVFEMDVITECGPATYTYRFRESGAPSPFVVLSPNPATSMLTLSVDKNLLRQNLREQIQQVMVHDKNGTAVLQRKYPANTVSASLNLYGLKPDVYTVRVFDGKRWTAIKFIKQ